MKQIVVFLFLISPVIVFAQVPKPSFELGSGIEAYKFQGIYTSPVTGIEVNINQLNPIYTLAGSLNIPLKQIREKLFLGVNPTISLGYSYGSFSGDIPLLATLKFGAASTKDDVSNFGFGVGAGLCLSMQSSYLNFGNYSVPFSSKQIAPTAMAEVSFDTNSRGIYQIRFELTPIPVQKYGDYTGNISQYNIRIIRILSN